MVSVARRNLFQDKTSLLISVGGVAFALLLVLTLDALVAGSLQQITAYINETKADVYVAQTDVRTMHMSASALPVSQAEKIQRLDGVARVEPILYTSNFVAAGDNRLLAYVIGFDSSSRAGGPWKLSSGDANIEHGEAVIDAVAAGKLGVGIGDEVMVMGSPFRVRALSSGATNFINSLAFVRFDDFAALRRSDGVASYLLVWLTEGVSAEEGARRIRSAVDDVSVVTRSEFATEEGRLVLDMTAEIMVIMNSIGFLIGLAAGGLTIYTASVRKLREYGVLKALGATNTWLYRGVGEQALLAIAIGSVVSVILAFALSGLLSLLVPEVPLRVELPSIAKVFGAATSISIVAAMAPVRQMAALDPVAVFRR
ncbi:MAG: ABC transporter permease [Chloroflexi bacterium]|nr:ABC transporter permease [Chloroflexota bacterium]